MSKRKILIGFLLIGFMIFSVELGFWVYEQIYARNQEKIDATPMDVVKVFQDAGYDIRSIREWENHEIGGRFGDVNEFFSLELDSQTVLVFSYPSWEIAKRAAEISNERDLQWTGGKRFSFHYGAVVVTIYSEKELGMELLKLLRENE